VPFLLADRARSECARSMRAVKGSLGRSPKERHREIEDWKALARANGTSRRASGWAGEKSRAVEDQPAPIPREKRASLEGACISFDELEGDPPIPTINPQPKGSHAKPYQVKQVREVILQHKLGGDVNE
jgi:hypothetical protein